MVISHGIWVHKKPILWPPSQSDIPDTYNKQDDTLERYQAFQNSSCRSGQSDMESSGRKHSDHDPSQRDTRRYNDAYSNGHVQQWLKRSDYGDDCDDGWQQKMVSESRDPRKIISISILATDIEFWHWLWHGLWYWHGLSHEHLLILITMTMIINRHNHLVGEQLWCLEFQGR